MSLTQDCRDIIVGAMLGDACLERNGRNVRLRIDHGQYQQAYVEWKHRMLAELSPSVPKRVEVFDQRTQQTYVHYRFSSRSIEILNEFHDWFYRQGVKSVPQDIGSHLNSALSIAVWYMDDGGRRGDCCSGYFNTQAFSVGDVQRLCESLRENFDVPTTIHFAAGRPRIYIAQKHFSRLCDLIRPHVIPEMQYKLL